MEWEGRTIRRKAESDVDCLSVSFKLTVSGSTHITLTVLAQSYVCLRKCKICQDLCLFVIRRYEIILGFFFLH